MSYRDYSNKNVYCRNCGEPAGFRNEFCDDCLNEQDYERKLAKKRVQEVRHAYAVNNAYLYELVLCGLGDALEPTWDWDNIFDMIEARWKREDNERDGD